MKKIVLAAFALLLATAPSVWAQDLSANEIIVKADNKIKGNSSYTEMSMTIVRPSWQRTVSLKSWTKTTDYSMTLISGPAKEKGKTFLKYKNKMWSWSPNINRMIKLPPSMMSQGWMGSDFSNDEMMKESSIIRDYDHRIIGSETVDGHDCYKIQLAAKEDAAVVWGKQIKWITKSGFMQMKTEYFDDEEYLIKTEIASKIQVMDGREIPTHFELIPEEDEGHKTIVEIKKIEFDIKLADNFFSQQNMKRVR